MKVMVEVTDTFNGEANYSWVKRKELELTDAMSNYAVVRRVKKEIGWSGMKCLTVQYGDSVELRPYGACQVAFINFVN